MKRQDFALLGWMALLFLLTVLAFAASARAECFGLSVAPQDEMKPYDRRAYQAYDRPRDIKALPAYLPYSGRSERDGEPVQLEHVVARREADRSHIDHARIHEFINDTENQFRALPEVNDAKGSKDAAGWLPAHNREWYAYTAVKVKLKYGLTADRAECAAYERVLGANP